MKKNFIIFIILCIIALFSYTIGYMTTTTTTNLSLVKPAEDDDSVNWFSTVNDNWDLIDAAFSELTTYLTDLDTEAELEAQLTDVTDVYTDNDFTDNSSNWDLAYGWGDHALEGYLTAETDPSFVDWSVSQAPDVIHADNYTDNDTTYTSSDFTHDDLTGVAANEHIDWTQDQGATDIHSGNYTDTNTTYTAGTGIDLTGTVFSLDANIDDLADVDLADIANEKILQYNSTSEKWECEDAAGGGYTNLTSFVDQTAWRLFYSDTAGDVTELALGTAGQYLKSAGATSAPTWDTPSGGGTVDTSGTPVDDDIAVFTDADTIEGQTISELGLAIGGIAYYVDEDGGDNGNTGLSPAQAWATLAYASSKTFNPGDKILLQRGDTWTNDVFDTPSSGMPDKPIYIGAYGAGTRPVLDGNNTPNFGITIDQDWIVIADIRITDMDMFGIYNQGSHIVIRNCELDNNDEGIRLAGTSSEDCLIEDCLIHDNDAGNDVGIWWGARYDDVTIKGCEIYNQNNAIDFYEGVLSDNILIKDNHLYDNSNKAIHLIEATDTGFTNITIDGNVIENNTGGSAVLLDHSTGVLVTRNIFSDNDISLGWGIDAYNCDGIIVSFNTFISERIALELNSITSGKVTGNVFYNSVEYAILNSDDEAGGTSFTYKDNHFSGNTRNIYDNSGGGATLTDGGGNIYLNEYKTEATGLESAIPDNSASGIQVKMTSGSLSDFGDVFYIDSTNKATLAKANGATTMPAVLIGSDPTGYSADEAVCTFMTSGVLRDDDWTWTAGGKLYVDASTAGDMTQTKPTGANIAQCVGVALTDDSIYFNPDMFGIEPTIISDLTEVTSEDADYMMIWDATDSSLKKVGMGEVRGAGGYTNLTEFVGQNNWKVFYSDGSGDVKELALGADGTYLKSNGAAVAPTFSSGAGASELSDLSDVNTSTPTNRYVLVADGTDFESRLLVEADISDLGTYLEDITAESILDLTDTPVAFDSGKFLKSGADAVTFASITETDITDLGSYLENVVEDTTPELGGDLGLNEKNIALDSTLTADHSYSGITDVVTAGESVVFGDVLYLDATAAEWKKANAAGTGTYPGLVIALESKSDGQACKVLRMGYIRDDSWSWTVGAILLLGETAGALTATVPSDTGDMVQRLGYAIHADKIYFMPSIDVGEI